MQKKLPMINKKCHNMQEKIQYRIENMQTMQVFAKKTCS